MVGNPSLYSGYGTDFAARHSHSRIVRAPCEEFAFICHPEARPRDLPHYFTK